jgi:hypothetical protein
MLWPHVARLAVPDVYWPDAHLTTSDLTPTQPANSMPSDLHPFDATSRNTAALYNRASNAWAARWDECAERTAELAISLQASRSWACSHNTVRVLRRADGRECSGGRRAAAQERVERDGTAVCAARVCRRRAGAAARSWNPAAHPTQALAFFLSACSQMAGDIPGTRGVSPPLKSRSPEHNNVSILIALPYLHDSCLHTLSVTNRRTERTRA